MKILSGLLAVIILVPILCFALSNRASVDVALWPLDGASAVPLYLLALGPLALGMLFGGIWGWACSVPHRLKARRLNKELGEMKKAAMMQQPAMSPQRSFWKPRS